MYLTTNVKEKNFAPALTSAKQFQFFQIDLAANRSPDNQQISFVAVATFLKVPNKFVLKILAFITHNF
jgi:hypothetical protein